MKNIRTLGLTGLAALVFALAGCGTQGSTGRNPIVNQDGNGSQIKDSGHESQDRQDTPDGRNETNDGCANNCDYDANEPRTDGNSSRDAQDIETDASDSCIEYCEVKDGGDSPDAGYLDAGQDGGELDSGFDSGYRTDGGNDSRDAGYTLPEITAGPDLTLQLNRGYCINYNCTPSELHAQCGDVPFAPGHSAEGFATRGQIHDWEIYADFNGSGNAGFLLNRPCMIATYDTFRNYSEGNILELKVFGKNDRNEEVSDTASVTIIPHSN